MRVKLQRRKIQYVEDHLHVVQFERERNSRAQVLTSSAKQLLGPV